ncbi:hypothetical protein [Ensifer canadensis]|uniref:hypothetical protein n=1 Tax=Ensifer canadensis TaxID=555315 RepID=UPI0035E3CEFF
MPWETFRTTTGEVVRVDVRAIITIGESPVRAGELTVFISAKKSPYIISITENETAGPVQTLRRLMKDQP